MNLADEQDQLDKIADRVARCRACRLCQQANKAVPGEGPPDARVFFIGEAPGFYEDQQGRPFVGAAGRLLDQLLDAIGLKRDAVFIGNMVKHRPPGNRDPQEDELKACAGFLDEQLRIVDPEIIVTLGRFAMNRFLPDAYISKVHGQARFIQFAGQKRILIPVYHPAAALRNGTMMTAIKKDFQKVCQFLEELEAKPPSDEKPEEEAQLKLI